MSQSSLVYNNFVKKRAGQPRFITRGVPVFKPLRGSGGGAQCDVTSDRRGGLVDKLGKPDIFVRSREYPKFRHTRIDTLYSKYIMATQVPALMSHLHDLAIAACGVQLLRRRLRRGGRGRI